MDPRLAHVRHWIFDLDNCLYPAETRLFDLIDERMTAYIARLLSVEADEARRVQKAHFHTHGTTLRGLMHEHDVDPHHFLDDVHDIPLDRVCNDERLARGLARLPGQKLVFTNGDAPYARRVLEAIGIGDAFEALHDIHAAELRPKPDAHGYRLLLDKFAIDPARALMVEDMAQNLKPAKDLGLTTVWVDNGSERGNHGHHPDFIDFTIRNVGEWLETITKEDQ
ncbi:pyrimidine 5'-nucleotidase [Sphingomonas rhizophila]|uniref:Pyrimidine 5'-nucleotidase n=1 Tax=Sphingomonas rhizophila TaxID=2071607 RepID=A0A7G9SAA1_9SPHN|nr:pyrimidine 5'-nucleotidase [Sphingomonas rhizophila]QNN64776.1 pyrimidine 5'-nucleotidase [Sphingomonas rhizophila]